METTENNQLTKDQGIMELLELLRRNDMKEAANSIFEMASYVDVMEKKMDAVLQELVTVKDQLHKMEEREAERGLKPALKRSAEKLEKKFSKTELMKKPFLAKRKLLCGILKCVDAAIEKTEKLALDVRQQRTGKERQGTDGIVKMGAVPPAELAMVAEQEFQYGAEAFEAYQKSNPLPETGAETVKKPIQKNTGR